MNLPAQESLLRNPCSCTRIRDAKQHSEQTSLDRSRSAFVQQTTGFLERTLQQQSTFDSEYAIMMRDCCGIVSLLRSKRQRKQNRRTKELQELDYKRQTQPNGMPEIALGTPFWRDSFTAADPGLFYKGDAHATDGIR